MTLGSKLTCSFHIKKGHSAWGQFLLKGRIRAWDGMFSITKEYTPDSRGRWLYRGYCIGGNLIGRWRDTHSAKELNGYEGKQQPLNYILHLDIDIFLHRQVLS